MSQFTNYNCGNLIKLISEAHLQWNYQQSGDVEYLREFASQNFFPVGKSEDISAASIKREHIRYKKAASELLKICPKMFEILNDWCAENETNNSPITDEMKKHRNYTYHDIIKRLEQQDCAVMVFGDTGSGKSTLINMILEEELMRTSAIKTTFTVCEVRYSETKKYSIAETENSEFIEKPYPSFTKDMTTTSDRQHFDYIRERYECPIDLLDGGIMITDSPGLNENDSLTKLVQDYIKHCLVFICVINRGLTESLQNLLNELKANGRTSAKSIFFVVTHLDDKELIEQQKAMNQIHLEVGKLYQDYDPLKNCCMLNPSKAFKTYSNYKFYERAHYEFLQKFIPFLSNALNMKLEYSFNELNTISDCLDEAIHVKYNQSISDLDKCEEIKQSIRRKIQRYNELKGHIMTKTKSLSNNFNTQLIQTILETSDTPDFKNQFEQHAMTITFPSSGASGQRTETIEDLKFIPKGGGFWSVEVTDKDKYEMLKKYALSLRATKTLFDPNKQDVTKTKHVCIFNHVEFCKLYCQHRLSLWMQKRMEPVLEDQINIAFNAIRAICRYELQILDNQIMNDYQKLTSIGDRKWFDTRIQERRKGLLEKATCGSGTLSMFTRTKLWFSHATLDITSPMESIADWFKDITPEVLKKNVNGFKLNVSQEFYQRIINRLKKQKKNLEKDSEKEGNSGATSVYYHRFFESNQSHDSESIVMSILDQFEKMYTGIEQLAGTVQTGEDAEKWKHICRTYTDKLEARKNLLHYFRAIHLSVWPLKSSQIVHDTNMVQESRDHEYNGQLINDKDITIPVFIRQLTEEFNMLNVFNHYEKLFLLNERQHMLHCYGIYTEDLKLFIVTEPFQSRLESFLTDINGKSLTTDERLRLALELAEGIQYLHEKQILYGCIHPNSIIITSDQHIKLNLIGEKDDFLYVPPEHIFQRRSTMSFYDYIYAFGLVLYRLFHTHTKDIEAFHSGKWLLPIDDINTTNIDENHSFMKRYLPEIVPNINDTMKNLIKMCCSVDVLQRPNINAIIECLNVARACC